MKVLFQEFSDYMSGYLDGLILLAPKIIIVTVILLIVWFISRSIRNMANKKLKKNMEDPLLAEFLATMTRAVIIIIGLLFVFRILGFGGLTASILAGAGITAFIIGFALRDIGENLLAGILMAF